MKEHESIWPGLAIAAFGAWQTYAASTISSRSLVPNDPVSSATLPLVLGVLTFVTGAALLVRRSLRYRADARKVPVEGLPEVTSVSRQDALRVVGAVAACVVYAVLLPKIGYAISTPLLVAILIGLATTDRIRPVTTTVVAVSVSTVCYLLFGLLLGADIDAFPL